MYYLVKWLKLVSQIDGFGAEAFIITIIAMFFIFVLLLRGILPEFKRSPAVIITEDLNKVSMGLCFVIVLTYWALIYLGPVYFDTPYGFYSDHIIYAFRLALVALFGCYIIYLSWQQAPHIFYTFEYHFIVVGAMLGLSMMTISSNFLNLLLSMELYSICIYYLINDKRSSVKTHESAFKYFIISSFSTAFYLFGVFWVYYSYGSFEYEALAIVPLNGSILGAVGYFFILCALMIKVGAGVFFFWVVDAYEGASYPTFVFLNLFVKPVFLLVVFKAAIISGSPALFWIFQKVFFISAITGSLGAAMHTKLKRFLIFTSLYNMGFLSCFFWVPNSYMLNGFVAFFIIYVINSFCLVVSFSLLTNKYQNFVVVDIKELSSVLPQDRRYAFALIYFLLVISGLPPFSFFFVKYYLFFKFAHVGIGYVIVLLLTSAIAIFYYVRTIRIILEARRPTFLLAIRSLGLGFFALVSVLNIYFLFFAEHLIEILNTLPI